MWLEFLPSFCKLDVVSSCSLSSCRSTWTACCVRPYPIRFTADGIVCTPSFTSHFLCSCTGSCTRTWHIPSRAERLKMSSPPTDFQKMSEKILNVVKNFCKFVGIYTCYQVLEYFNVVGCHCRQFWYWRFYQTKAAWLKLKKVKIKTIDTIMWPRL